MQATPSVVGFGVFNGYTRGYTYRRAREVRAGIGQDDVRGGGRMKGQKVNALADDDTPHFMSASGWLGDLRGETEVMPNAREGKLLGWIEAGALYKEYQVDQEEAGPTKGSIAGFALWKKVWELHFADPKVREQKAVSGKHRKQALGVATASATHDDSQCDGPRIYQTRPSRVPSQWAQGEGVLLGSTTRAVEVP